MLNLKVSEDLKKIEDSNQEITNVQEMIRDLKEKMENNKTSQNQENYYFGVVSMNCKTLADFAGVLKYRVGKQDRSMTFVGGIGSDNR